MAKLKNTLIIGLGMMGGSLCRSIKNNKVSEKISAYDTNKKSLDYALKNKMIDHAVYDYKSIPNPDLIIICTPLSSYLDIVKQILASVNNKTIITDIGSSKGIIHNKVTKLVNTTNCTFLSSHPMVGSECSGIKNHTKDLYNNKVVFLIDKHRTSKATYTKVRNFWKSIGALTYDIDSKKHDLLMSQTSHIAHLMAYIFMGSLPQSAIDKKNLPLLLGGGIREHVRLSKSNPKMWTDIFINNKSNILKSLARIQKNTLDFKKLIESLDEENIYSLLEKIHIKTK